MYYHASKHQLNHIAELISSDFKIYAPKSINNIEMYSEIINISDISWQSKKTIFSFKNILFPNNKNVGTQETKIAFLALPLCDIVALNLFLKQFNDSGLILSRSDIFIVGSNCIPDHNCFCDLFNLDKLYNYDMFVVKDDEKYNIIANGWKAKEIINKIGLKSVNKKLVYKPKIKSDKIDLEQTKKIIDDKNLTHDFWLSIANNCFACGACSAVCPLCFC